MSYNVFLISWLFSLSCREKVRLTNRNTTWGLVCLFIYCHSVGRKRSSFFTFISRKSRIFVTFPWGISRMSRRGRERLKKKKRNLNRGHNPVIEAPALFICTRTGLWSSQPSSSLFDPFSSPPGQGCVDIILVVCNPFSSGLQPP